MKLSLYILSLLSLFLIASNNKSSQISPPLRYEIDSEYWESCEIGEEACVPLTFFRSSLEDSVKVILPCGGTETFVYLFKDCIQNRLEEQHVYHPESPVFGLTGLEDGRYGFYMLACQLGGGVSFYLETKRK